MDTGRCLLCAEEESEYHLLLQCPEMQRWREELLNNKWTHIKEKITLREVLSTVPLNREIEVPSGKRLSGIGKKRQRTEHWGLGEKQAVECT